MTTATAIPIDVPVLTWSRVAGNRRKAWLLGALTLLAQAPFVWGVSYMVATWIVVPMTPHAIATRSEIRREEHALQSATGMDAESRQEWERVIEKKRASLQGSGVDIREHFYDLVILLAILQSAALGLLFWSIAAAPTAKLLVEAGASPAGLSEAEARQLLASLALAAGLPSPKLYIIESSAPNAFAAGVGPHQSMVAVTRGLLQLLDREELEGVLAHEISHIGNQDVALNTAVASVALFLRIPYLLFRRELQAGKQMQLRRRRSPWRLALSPMGVYILFVAPVLAAAIRGIMARSREHLADADAVQLTGSPSGLLRALAKIGGSGSTIPGANAAFAHYYFASPTAARAGIAANLMPTHPPVAERIQRLAAMPGAPSLDVMKEAIEVGRRYAREHPLVETVVHATHDELSSFNRGNPMGRVYRMVSPESAPVYETPSKNSQVLARIKPGSLIVVFDDPGKMRQVNTAHQTFGYIERNIKLQAMDSLIPAEVYDPVARTAAEANLPPLGIKITSHTVPAPRAKTHPDSLSIPQILAATALAVAVFAGMFLALMKFGH